jgi:hypothetical protein
MMENQPMSWDYAVVEDALAQMYRIDSAHRKAFRGRLQNFQRLGIPLNLKVGKGRKISYTDAEIFQWTLCLELSEYGVNPSTITSTVKACWESHLLDAFRSAYQSGSDQKNDILLCFSPRLMSAPGASPGMGPPKIMRGEVDLRMDEPPTLAQQTGEKGKAGWKLSFIQEHERGALIINLSEMLRQLHGLRYVLGVGTVLAATLDAMAAAKTRPAATTEGGDDVGSQANLDEQGR